MGIIRQLHSGDIKEKNRAQFETRIFLSTRALSLWKLYPRGQMEEKELCISTDKVGAGDQIEKLLI